MERAWREGGVPPHGWEMAEQLFQREANMLGGEVLETSLYFDLITNVAV